MVIFNVFLSAGAGRVVSASATLLALATPVYSGITIWPGRPYTCPAFFASQMLSGMFLPHAEQWPLCLPQHHRVQST